MQIILLILAVVTTLSAQNCSKVAFHPDQTNLASKGVEIPDYIEPDDITDFKWRGVWVLNG